MIGAEKGNFFDCHREQERRLKAEEARSETERILAQQAADLAAKKADMNRRDAEREAAKAAKARAVPSCAHHFLCVCGNAGIYVCV